jgi:hypothetical protein
MEGGKGSHHHVFRKLEVHHLLGMGFSGDTDDAQWLHNHVYDIGYPSPGYGWYTHGRRNLFRGNVVHDNVYGFHFYGTYASGPVPSDDSVIERTLIYNIGTRGKWCWSSAGYDVNMKRGGVGLLLRPGTGNVFRNNVVFGNDKALSIGGTSVLNNTFFGNASGVTATSTDVVIKNNIFFQSSEYDYQGTTLVATNLLGNPGFVNAAARNFHLLAHSPAIDKGTALVEVKEDFDGVSRPPGKPYDIGAYEYTTTTVRLPAAPSAFAVH